jgi:hypothetical protein
MGSYCLPLADKLLSCSKTEMNNSRESLLKKIVGVTIGLLLEKQAVTNHRLPTFRVPGNPILERSEIPGAPATKEAGSQTL